MLTCSQVGSKLCVGRPGEPCVFGAGGAPAQPHGPQQCLFCDVERLNAAFLQGDSSLAARRRFVRLGPEAQATALERVQDGGFRAWLQGSAAAPTESRAVGAPAPRVQHWPHGLSLGREPFSRDELDKVYATGSEIWADALASRRALVCSLGLTALPGACGRRRHAPSKSIAKWWWLIARRL